MATTYEWDVVQAELVSTGGLNQVVHKCFWKCTATADSGATKEQFGVVELDVKNLDPNNFISWPVDKAQIVEWVKNTVHREAVEAGLHPEVETHSFVDPAVPGTVAANVNPPDVEPK